MNELATKKFIVEMLAQGFTLAPCKNPHCEQLFSSGDFCSGCEVTYEVS